MKNWELLRQNVQDAFCHVPRPDLSAIPIIGCCDRHEPDYDWYRHLTWQEFEDAYDTHGFDSADFVTIHPLAFHYYTPGVISAAIKRLVMHADYQWNDEAWIRHYIVSPDRGEGFIKDYLPLFDFRQRQVIAETLIWYKAWFWEHKGWDYDEPYDDEVPGDEKATIADSIKLVWQYET